MKASSEDSYKSKCYTVEEAINNIGFGPFQVLVSCFAGMIWTTDAMEIMLLSILSPIVKCEWHLKDWEEAMITAVVFAGFFFGALIWGVLADLIGRKKVLIIVTVLLLILGLCSALSPNFITLLIFRGLIGFNIGGSEQSVTYYTEFLPKKFRGTSIILLNVWWGVGSVLAALLAMIVISMPGPISTTYFHHINWRIYLALCALPMVIVLILGIFVPESARFYVSKNQYHKGEKIIAILARMNRKPNQIGHLISQEEKELKEQIMVSNNVTDKSDEYVSSDIDDTPLLQKPHDIGNDTKKNGVLQSWNQLKEKINYECSKHLINLLSEGMWKTTALLLFIWFGSTWFYYGAVLLTTTILEMGHNPHCGHHEHETIETGCQMSNSFYLKLVWTSVAEFPGLILAMLIIELIGRKITMAVLYFGAGVSIGLIFVCTPEIWLTVFLFGTRTFASGAYQVAYVYTTEVYPTNVRGLAVGLMSSSARIGAIVTPFVAQALFPISDYTTVGLYVASSIVLIVLCLLLPIETKGRSLKVILLVWTSVALSQQTSRVYYAARNAEDCSKIKCPNCHIFALFNHLCSFQWYYHYFFEHTSCHLISVLT